MIYLKRLWNLVAYLISGCFTLLLILPSVFVEYCVIAPILYIATNKDYTEINDLFAMRAGIWLNSKLIIDTNRK